MATLLNPARRDTHLRGFTLIELMVVVVIVGVLAAVALPAYQSSVRKSRRADAITSMQQVQQAEERWRANNTTYSGSLTAIGISSATTPDGYYTLTLAVPAAAVDAATQYTLTAVPTTKNGQNRDTACASMVLTWSAGTTSYSPAACWSK